MTDLSDPERRAALVERVGATDGRLIDPPLAASGRGEISEMAARLQSQFPGHQFVRVSAIDEHHDHFRFAWDLVATDGSVALSGLDVRELAGHGTISRITGFFSGRWPRTTLSEPPIRFDPKRANQVPHIGTKDNATLFYRDWGAGKPVVSCAGWTLSSVL